MKIKLAVVGVGAMGRNHVRVLMDLPDVELVGVADVNVNVAEAVAHKYHVPVRADALQLFDEFKPDAVVIAVPTSAHFALTLAAIERGMHVLVEKPIAATLPQAQEMIAAAEQRGVKLAVGHIERFNPAIIELKRRIDRGELGRMFMIHARRQSPYPGRIFDTGVASDLATHELDIMRYMANSKVAHLNAQVSYVLPQSGHEDIILGLLRFQNGVLGLLDVNWITPTSVRESVITGERGMFVVNYLSQELSFYENPAMQSPPQGSIWDFTVQAGNRTQYQINHREPLRNELESFVEVVQTGRKPLADGGDGLEALRLALELVALGGAEAV